MCVLLKTEDTLPELQLRQEGEAQCSLLSLVLWGPKILAFGLKFLAFPRVWLRSNVTDRSLPFECS